CTGHGKLPVYRPAQAGSVGWRTDHFVPAPGTRLQPATTSRSPGPCRSAYQLNRIAIWPSRPPGSYVLSRSRYAESVWKMVAPAPGVLEPSVTVYFTCASGVRTRA